MSAPATRKELVEALAQILYRCDAMSYSGYTESYPPPAWTAVSETEQSGYRLQADAVVVYLKYLGHVKI